MHWITAIGLGLFIGCQTRQERKQGVATTPIKIDSTQQIRQDSILKVALQEEQKAHTDSLAAIAKSKPIWGKRMKVIGDFDGDGRQDTLYEKYISLPTGKETNKDYDFGEELGNDCCDWLFYKQAWIFEKKPLVQLASKNPAIKSFNVESGGCQNGFEYLKNVGDLNGDSTDEIVYYIYDVDMSTLNSCALATYKNGEWKEIHQWQIYEFDFWEEEGKEKPDPVFIKKRNGKVWCKELDNGLNEVWKPLKTNW